MNADTLWLGAFLALIVSRLDRARGEGGWFWNLISGFLFFGSIVAVQGPPSQDRPADDGYTVPYDRFTLRPGETLRQMDARYRRDFQRARIAGWVLAAADIAITQRCLDRGTCHEGNPIYGSHPSLGRMLAIRVPLEALIDFGARRLFRHDPEQAITMLRVKAGVTGVVVGMNLRF